MTDSPCQTLDAYLDGRLSDTDVAAFEAHLADCETCIEASAPSDDVGRALRSLSDVACPPAVLEGALAEARRRAPDRAALPLASRRSSRWRRVVLPLVALVAAVVLWSVLPSDDETPAPLATQDTETPDPEPIEDTTPPAPEIAAQQPDLPPPVIQTRPTPTPPPPPTPQRQPSQDAQPQAQPDVPSQVELATAVPADSVEAAKQELLVAFAIVADAQDHAADAVADGVGRVSDAIRSTPTLASPR